MSTPSHYERPVAVVTGAAGQLGSTIARSFGDHYRVVALTRADVDVTHSAAVMATVGGAQPSVIINCTAYNDVDGAEDDAQTALLVNAMAVRSLARVAELTGAVLVHYSTDFVFDGHIDRAYRETDRPCPPSVYAQSKLLGEWMAASVPRHYILRVESLFGADEGRSSVDGIVNGLRSGREARVFHDREVSPSFIPDVVSATRHLLASAAPPGIYHCVNSGSTTWLGLAREIARQLGVAQRLLRPVSVDEVKLRAARPKFAALDCGKLARVGYAMPTWQDAVSRYVQKIR